MSLQEKFISSFIAFENKGIVDLEDPLHKIRTKAIQKFESMSFPTRKDEAWKYTRLNAILKEDYTLFPQTSEVIEYRHISPFLINSMESYRLVFVDGVFNSHLSETTHEGYDICVMSSALTKTTYKPVINQYFNKQVLNTSIFSELNTAFAKEGFYINIPDNTVVPKPVQILYLTTEKNKNVWQQPRNLVVVGKNSQVQLIERYHSLSDQKVVSNSVTELIAQENSNVQYYKLQNDLESTSLIDNTFISQEKSSTVHVTTLSLGGKLIRNNLWFYQKDERCNSDLFGLSILENRQHVDNQTFIEHAHPNTESTELYKGIYNHESTGVFNGKILVQKEAQKTNAFQQNNSILIGDKATMNAKPQLEIFADDVKCSHGCTIGQMDDEALFYMQSRGISYDKAQALLLYAFGNDVIDTVKIPALKSVVLELISKKLGIYFEFDL